MKIHATTILAVRHAETTVVAGDGQMTMGHTIMKATAKKVRRMHDGQIVSGFAGSTADALALFERFEETLRQHGGKLVRSAAEMAKQWRLDKVLRQLEAMMIVADKSTLLTISGSGDVIEPDDGLAAIGSGAPLALSAARALTRHAPNMPAREIATQAMQIASEIDIYTNNNLVVEEL